jgi:hypothetical protein
VQLKRMQRGWCSSRGFHTSVIMAGSCISVKGRPSQWHATAWLHRTCAYVALHVYVLFVLHASNLYAHNAALLLQAAA